MSGPGDRPRSHRSIGAACPSPALGQPVERRRDTLIEALYRDGRNFGDLIAAETVTMLRASLVLGDFVERGVEESLRYFSLAVDEARITSAVAKSAGRLTLKNGSTVATASSARAR